MSVLATFSIPSSSFVLGDALQIEGIDRVEFERVVPSRRDVMPYFWVWGSDFDEFEATVVDEPAIESITVIDTVEEGALYRAEWDDFVPGFIRCVRGTNAMLLEGFGTDRDDGTDEWWFELRFSDRGNVERFHSVCNASNLGFQLRNLSPVQDTDKDQSYGLTEKQRETLIAATTSGYFDEPRTASVDELAEHFDVSTAAISGRLRRAEKTLIKHTLLESTSLSQ